MDGSEGRQGMGSDRGNTSEPSGGISPNLSSSWVSVLDTQALLQMEWLLCRVRRIRDTRHKERLRVDGRHSLGTRTVHNSKTKRISLFCLHARLCSFRDILSRTPKRRYTTTERRRRSIEMDIAKELDIITPAKFRELLEDKVAQDNVTYLDAIVDICERTGLEIESVPRMLNIKTKKILRNEATNLNMLKKKGARLPV